MALPLPSVYAGQITPTPCACFPHHKMGYQYQPYRATVRIKLVNKGQVLRTVPILVLATPGATKRPLCLTLGRSCSCLDFSLTFSTKQRKFRQRTRTGLLNL